MRASFLASLVLLAAAAPAPAPEWRMAAEYDVLLTAYDIEPKEIRLKAGEAVRLRFVNNSNQKLSFSAEGFFRSAQLRQRDSDRLSDGALEVGPLATETIAVVPKAGRYRFGGGNFLHRLLGMSGRIVVE